RLRLGGKHRFQRISNCLCEFTLDREDIRHFPVVCLAPGVYIRARVDKLARDADLAASAAHAALKHVGYAELQPDLFDGLCGTTVLHDRRAGDDAKVAD